MRTERMCHSGGTTAGDQDGREVGFSCRQTLPFKGMVPTVKDRTIGGQMILGIGIVAEILNGWGLSASFFVPLA